MAEVAKRTEEAKMAKVAADTVRKPTAVQHKTPAKAKRVRQGRPIGNGEFLRWTDITTSRVQSVVENLFGESIQLHQKHLLEDEFRQRPMIVHYSSWLNYVVEALVVLLFIVGMWCGRHSRFFWLCLSWFGLDMLLHVGMGFEPARSTSCRPIGYSSSPSPWALPCCICRNASLLPCAMA